MHFHCLYLSRATKSFSYDEVHALLEVSRRNNANRSVTGILMCKRNYFMQWIEGEQQKVMDLCLRIENDDRHPDPIILHQGHLEERVFPDWSMAFSHLSVLDEPTGQTVHTKFTPDQWPPDAQVIDSPGVETLIHFIQDN